jgi:hypothetical protein
VPGPSLIQEYRAALSALLPARIIDELADGLAETYDSYLSQGLSPDAAACAALAEFGEPEIVAAAFTRASPGRRTARLLLATGPAVGACWGAVLVADRAWSRTIPATVPLLLGMTLIAVIAMLAIAALAPRYRPARRACAAACAGLVILDAAAVIAVLLSARSVPWPAFLAVAASGCRIAFSTRAMRSVLLA